jgi:hypothetical protein
MPWGLSWVDIVGLTAGILIIGVGTFVFTAKPHSWLHRLFFVLALMDGASTILFTLALAALGTEMTFYFLGTYFYHWIAFIALLALFGASFPKPIASRRLRIAIVGGIVLVSTVGILVYLLDHALFWTPVSGSAFPAVLSPMGNMVTNLFMVAMAFLVLRLTFLMLRETSELHRRQGAYVLGGMALAYLPGPWTVLVQDVAARGLAPFFDGRWDRIVTHWVALLAAGAMLASIALLALRPLRVEARDERRFIFGCYAGVGLLSVAALAGPSEILGVTLRRLSLLAYPVLLGFAIARYEVFDIDRQLRRAATVSLAAVGLTVSFVLAENALENVLASRLFGGIPSVAVSGSVAAIVTAFAFVPVARASRKAASRIVPELSHDELQARKLEIYRHSLAGALADGILKEGESRTLAALRSSLGISDADHARMLSEVAA